MTIAITKAEGTERGNGWYFLINGKKDEMELQDVGGEDWYRSKTKARVAAKYFVENCYYNREYGWCV